jgi:hypothetical protein
MPRISSPPRAYWLSWLIGLALLAGTGCVSTRAFVPGERVTALSPRGNHFAAEYAVSDGSHPIAEVKVWSRGATRDGDGTIIHVGFQVDNVGAAPVQLEPAQLYLDDVKLEEGELDRIRPSSTNGETTVPPGEEREVEVSFQLPDDVWPGDVLNYRVVWRLRNGGSYSQKTPFIRARGQDYADPSFSFSYGYYGFYPGYSYWPYGYRAWPSWRYRRYYPGPGWRYRPFP